MTSCSQLETTICHEHKMAGLKQSENNTRKFYYGSEISFEVNSYDKQNIHELVIIYRGVNYCLGFDFRSRDECFREVDLFLKVCVDWKNKYVIEEPSMDKCVMFIEKYATQYVSNFEPFLPTDMRPYIHRCFNNTLGNHYCGLVPKIGYVFRNESKVYDKCETMCKSEVFYGNRNSPSMRSLISLIQTSPVYIKYLLRLDL